MAKHRDTKPLRHEESINLDFSCLSTLVDIKNLDWRLIKPLIRWRDILNDIPPRAVVDYSEEWTEEDMRDLTIYSLRYAAQSFGEEEGENAEGKGARELC